MGFLEPGTQLRWMAALAVVSLFALPPRILSSMRGKPMCSGRRTWCGRGNQRAGLPFRDVVSGGLALWLADKWLGWQGMTG